MTDQLQILVQIVTMLYRPVLSSNEVDLNRPTLSVVEVT